MAEPIAAGGVGQVWRAADLLLDREVAVKLLRPEYADHPDTLERFRAEAKHAGSLTHPCVARVYDYGNAGPAVPPYLVMEYVDGPSLADMLAVDPVHPIVALDVAAQAAAGLDAAHRIGLVHRDIKPGNILVGADGLVKITDFGIAHAAGSAPITGPGLVMGTTQYMAPERIAGGQATPASDLYALGILIYECLTGLPPYDGGTAEVMAGHLYLPMPPLPAGAPPELDELITRLTAKDPAARMSDAAEVAAIATRLRDALAADAGLTVAAPAFAGAATGSRAFAGAAPEQAGPGMTGETALLDDQPLRPLPPVPSLPLRQPDSPADRPGRTGRRRATTLAAGVTVLAGAGVAWLLASGALHDSPAADHLTVSPPATIAPGGSASLAPTATGPAPSHPAAGASARPGGSATASASRQATNSPGTSPSSSASPSQSSSASHSPGPTPTTTSPAPWPTLPLPLISLGL
ncbi:MAG TPA: serine/threonine-protein kinase [Trebonia sp.]|nr:serine/threonine-protein kinase [Trebonia sp.]